MVEQKRKRTYRRKGKLTKTQKVQVKRMVNALGEKKYKNVGIAGASIGYAGDIASFSTFYIAAGTGDSDRIGDSIRPAALHIKGHVIGADTTNVVRIIVFQNRTTNLSLGSTDVGKVLSSSYLSTNLAPDSLYAHDYRKNFRILFDRRITTNQSGNDCVPFSAIIPAKKMYAKVQYSGGSTTTLNGGMQLLIISDSAAVSHPAVYMVSRLEYYDN